jgi:prolipoprotein diacylglyceryltransferase
MGKLLLTVGGCMQIAFGAFHIWLARMIHLSPTLAAPDRELMQIFNVAVALTVLFFAYVSFFHRVVLQSTRLGRATLVFIAGYYFARAVIELFVTDISPLILGLCIGVGALYAVSLCLPVRWQSGVWLWSRHRPWVAAGSRQRRVSPSATRS